MVLVAAVLAVFAAGAYGGPVVGLLDTGDDFEDPASEAVQARDTVERVTGASAAPDAVVLVRLGAEAGTPQARAKLRRVVRLVEDPDVVRIRALRGTEPPELLSRDRRSTYVVATFAAGADEEDVAHRIEARLAREPGVTLGGGTVAFEQVGDQVEEDLRKAEMLAAPILFLFSLLVFRSVVAALLPLAVGATTIMVTFAALRVVNEFAGMSTFAINLITGLGLGLAIDYSLFMVSRFREEMGRADGTAEALRATVRTAGRTVLFSSVTVAAAMAAMLVFPLRFLYSMGVGGVLVALTAALRVADRAARAAGGARAARQRAQPQALAGRDEPRRRARARGRLVPAVARGHAPAGADRDRRGRGRCSRSACRSCGSSSRASTRPCCRKSARRGSSTTRCAPSSRPARRRRSRWWPASASAAARRPRTSCATCARSTAWPP